MFSKVEESIDSGLFSAFVTAVKLFFSQLSLGGLSSFTTEEKIVYLAARTRIATAIITSVKQDSKEVYSLAYEITEKFEKMFLVSDGSGLRLQNCSRFSDTLEQILKKKVSVLPKLKDKVIFLYTVDQEGALNSIVFDSQTDLSSYPVLIIVNKLSKQIFVLENREDVSNRLLFLASRAASNLNAQQWKNEFQLRDISDTLDCERLREQAMQVALSLSTDK